MLSGPIYRTGSIKWAKGGHGLAHTGLILSRHYPAFSFAKDGTSWNDTLIAVPPECY